mmetsp:Transcript_20595/g.52553  ORF Transcript_20595/g.52553 Transcript_20595/m.52553 type:complete len:215 (+) Transcript_20595:352-996(+)
MHHPRILLAVGEGRAEDQRAAGLRSHPEAGELAARERRGAAVAVDVEVVQVDQALHDALPALGVETPPGLVVGPRRGPDVGVDVLGLALALAVASQQRGLQVPHTGRAEGVPHPLEQACSDEVGLGRRRGGGRRSIQLPLCSSESRPTTSLYSTFTLQVPADALSQSDDAKRGRHKSSQHREQVAVSEEVLQYCGQGRDEKKRLGAVLVEYHDR